MRLGEMGRQKRFPFAMTVVTIRKGPVQRVIVEDIAADFDISAIGVVVVKTVEGFWLGLGGEGGIVIGIQAIGEGVVVDARLHIGAVAQIGVGEEIDAGNVPI